MTERTPLERDIRHAISRTVGSTIGRRVSDVKRVVDHTSLRHLDGSRKESDIDLTVVVSSAAKHSMTLWEKLQSVVSDYGLEMGQESFQVHVSVLDQKAWRKPEAYLSHIGVSFVKEVKRKGRVVYCKP